jgi:hypothetical protein
MLSLPLKHYIIKSPTSRMRDCLPLLPDSLLLQIADALAPEHADASAADVLATLRFHGIVEKPQRQKQQQQQRGNRRGANADTRYAAVAVTAAAAAAASAAKLLDGRGSNT